LQGKCSAITRAGTRCRRSAEGQNGLCFAHDPANAERRRRTAARGGRGKANKEVATLKDEIRDVIAGVKSGDLDRNDAAAMIQAYRALLEYIKLERAVVVEDDLAVRLEALKSERPHAS
jgi:hypothetical protein